MKKGFLTKRIIALTTVLIMGMSIVSGCSGEDKTTTTEKETSTTTTGDEVNSTDTDKTVKLTFSRSEDVSAASDIFANLDETWESNRWTDLYHEKLGIDVEYLWIAAGAEQGTQKFNAAVASGTIPDVVGVNKITLQQLVDAGLVVDIAPYYEEYASDLLKSIIDAGGDKCIQAATFNGVQYGVPYVDCDLETAQMLWIRQDWLEQTGMEAPTTTAELKELMIAFSEIAGDGAVGLCLSQDLWNTGFSGIKGFCNGYGAYPRFWVKGEDGSLQYGSTRPEMKEALAGLAELFKEGLISPEFYSMDGSKAMEALVSGKCGITYGYHAASLYPLQDSISNDENADWIPYQIVSSEDGATIKPGISMMTSSWYAVSSTCEHPEAFIQMLNLYCEKVYDQEKQEYSTYANPGGELEGIWRLSPVSMNSANKNQLTAQAIAEPLVSGNSADLWGEQLSMYEYSKAAQDGDRTLWGWNRVFGANGSQQLLISYQEANNFVLDEFYGASTETMTSKMTTLDSTLDEAFMKIIANQADIDSFDEAIAAWKAAGGDDITAEVNEWYKQQ